MAELNKIHLQRPPKTFIMFYSRGNLVQCEKFQCQRAGQDTSTSLVHTPLTQFWPLGIRKKFWKAQTLVEMIFFLLDPPSALDLVQRILLTTMQSTCWPQDIISVQIATLKDIKQFWLNRTCLHFVWIGCWLQEVKDAVNIFQSYPVVQLRRLICVQIHTNIETANAV